MDITNNFGHSNRNHRGNGRRPVIVVFVSWSPQVGASYQQLASGHHHAGSPFGAPYQQFASGPYGAGSPFEDPASAESVNFDYNGITTLPFAAAYSPASPFGYSPYGYGRGMNRWKGSVSRGGDLSLRGDASYAGGLGGYGGSLRGYDGSPFNADGYGSGLRRI